MSTKIYRVWVVTLSLLSGSYFANATTFTARASSNWNNTLVTWGTASLPTASDVVIIPNTFTVTVNITTAVASTVTINTGGKLTISNNDKLTIGGALSNAGNITMGTATSLLVGGTLTNSGIISTSTGTMNVTGSVTNSGTITQGAGNVLLGGSLSNSGTMTVAANGKLTFDGAANSTITSSGGTYTITGTVVLNMGAPTTSLDVQDAKFISGINSGGKYYFTLTRGIFKMDNTGTLNDSYNSGSTTALTIPYGVTLESDNGTMNLAANGTTGNVLLSGGLLLNGGAVNIQTNQVLGTGPGNDFQYYVNGGTPQLYINSGSLTVGGGFSPTNTASYIDFNMTGGTMEVTSKEASNNATFQLQDLAGGKTAMSGGKITIVEPGLGGNADLDMGGSNLSAYSVTGGTVQLGTSTMPASAGYYAIQPYPNTKYPNIDMEPGTAETAAANATGNFNMLSLYINSNATFDASGAITGGATMTNLNITGSDGAYAFDDEGTFTPGTSTVKFSGGVSQVITSSALSSVKFYNLQDSNYSGNVVLGIPTTVTNQLSFTIGKIDASAYPLTLSNGANAITGTGNSSYVITGDGVTNTGYLAIQGLTKNAVTTFPIGTSSYYLPFTLNPGNNTGTAYSAYVYPGVTTNAKSNGTSVSSFLLANMADLTWNIAQTTGSNAATLGLNWASSGTALEGSAFKTFGTNIGITQYSSSANAWQTVTGTGNVATGTASGSFSGVSQFSAIGTNTAILPLVLGNFNAVPQGGTALLTWAAFPDGQTGSFTIQRSPDGSSWKDIGVVQANVAATMETDYSFTDVTPLAGQDLYRLYIQNEDGSTSYSNVRVVEFSSTASLSLYPDPANTSLTIHIGHSSKALGIRLVNTAGMVLLSQVAQAGVATLTMNTGAYPAGVYYLEMLDGGRLLQTTAVMVVH